MANNYKKIYIPLEYGDAMKDLASITRDGEKRLRTCNATVGEAGNYVYLRSFNAIVSVIDKENDEAYDFLRLVYGYTRTSAQHIAKFLSDYNWGCLYRFGTDKKGTYYERIM